MEKKTQDRPNLKSEDRKMYEWSILAYPRKQLPSTTSVCINNTKTH